MAVGICREAGYEEREAERVGELVRKEGLRSEDEETVVLEDVACLVFLEDRFEAFEREKGYEEEKVVDILRKSLRKMSARGRELAVTEVVGGLEERSRGLVGKAMEGL